MKKIEEFKGFTQHALLNIGLIIACSGVSNAFAQSGEAKPDLMPADVMIPNLVVMPEYGSDQGGGVTGTPEATAEEKLQYDPVTDETPIIMERKAKAEKGAGAEYEEEPEMMIAPQPEFSVKDEKIEEKKSEVGAHQVSGAVL